MFANVSKCSATKYLSHPNLVKNLLIADHKMPRLWTKSLPITTPSTDLSRYFFPFSKVKVDNESKPHFSRKCVEH